MELLLDYYYNVRLRLKWSDNAYLDVNNTFSHNTIPLLLRIAEMETFHIWAFHVDLLNEDNLQQWITIGNALKGLLFLVNLTGNITDQNHTNSIALQL